MLMLIVAYTGPRPVYHSHETFLELMGGVSSLSKHLAQYHPSHANCPSPHSVHCHWIWSDFLDAYSVGNGSAGSVFIATACEAPSQHDLDFPPVSSLQFLIVEELVPVSIANARVDSVDSVTNPLQVLQCFCVWIC